MKVVGQSALDVGSSVSMGWVTGWLTRLMTCGAVSGDKVGSMTMTLLCSAGAYSGPSPAAHISKAGRSKGMGGPTTKFRPSMWSGALVVMGSGVWVKASVT